MKLNHQPYGRLHQRTFSKPVSKAVQGTYTIFKRCVLIALGVMLYDCSQHKNYTVSFEKSEKEGFSLTRSIKHDSAENFTDTTSNNYEEFMDQYRNGPYISLSTSEFARSHSFNILIFKHRIRLEKLGVFIPENQDLESIGSGFFVLDEKGKRWMITNYHVLKEHLSDIRNGYKQLDVECSVQGDLCAIQLDPLPNTVASIGHIPVEQEPTPPLQAAAMSGYGIQGGLSVEHFALETTATASSRSIIPLPSTAQINLRKICPGMSGSPVIDPTSKKLIGILSQVSDDELVFVNVEQLRILFQEKFSLTLQ